MLVGAIGAPIEVIGEISLFVFGSGGNFDLICIFGYSKLHFSNTSITFFAICLAANFSSISNLIDTAPSYALFYHSNLRTRVPWVDSHT